MCYLYITTLSQSILLNFLHIVNILKQFFSIQYAFQHFVKTCIIFKNGESMQKYTQLNFTNSLIGCRLVSILFELIYKNMNMHKNPDPSD